MDIMAPFSFTEMVHVVVAGYVNIAGVKLLILFNYVMLLGVLQFKIGGIMAIIKSLFHVVIKVSERIFMTSSLLVFFNSFCCHQ